MLCTQTVLSLLAAAVRSSSAAEDLTTASLKAAFDYRTILNMLMNIVNAAGSEATPLKTPLAKVRGERSCDGRQCSYIILSDVHGGDVIHLV